MDGMRKPAAIRAHAQQGRRVVFAIASKGAPAWPAAPRGTRRASEAGRCRPAPAAGRGVLFSFAAMLLSICILMFAAITAEWSVQSRQTASSLIDFDRTTDAYSNAEDGLLHISSIATNVSVEDCVVHVSATLPAIDVSNYLSRFAQFESNFSDQSFAAGTSSLGAREFVIQPSNIRVAHLADRLIVSPNAPAAPNGAPASYDVEVIFPTATADAAEWSSMAPDPGSGGLMVHVRVRDARYAVLYDFTEKLNRSANSTLNITSAGITVATVSFTPSSSLEAASGHDIGLKTSIGLSIPAYVETTDTLSVVSAVNKTGRLKVGG